MVLNKLRAAASYLYKSKLRLLCILLLCISIAIVFSYIFTARNTLLIYDEGDTRLIDYSGDTEQALLAAGIKLSDLDSYTLSPDGVPQLTINRAKTVNVIFDDGSSITALCDGFTVADVLDQLELSLAEDDTLDCALTDPLTDDMQIHLSVAKTEIYTTQEEIPYETVYTDTDSLPQGTNITLQYGVNGIREKTFRQVVRAGEVIEEELLSDEIVQAPVPEQISRGTADPNAVMLSTLSGDGYSRSSFAYGVSPVPSGNVAIRQDTGSEIVTAFGETLSYSRKVTVLATAYTTERDANPSPTYTGTVARVGAIAVDPSVIPLGSRLYIVGSDGTWIYGYATAEDLGGGIKGNRVDLFYNTYSECMNFGTHSADVYILN